MASSGAQKRQTTTAPKSTIISNTIDLKHTEMLNHFQEIEEVTIPKLIAEKAEWKAKVASLKEGQIDEYMDIRDKVLSLQQQIRDLRGQKRNYLLDNSKYVFQYFEQKQKISNSVTIPVNSSNVLNCFKK
jgi:cytoplasmic iron level regulating protein YaaA (DUF328/UPF0246 family)